MQLTIKFYCKIRYPLRNTWGIHFFNTTCYAPSKLIMHENTNKENNILLLYVSSKKEKTFCFLEVSPKPNKDLIHLYESY